MASQRSSPPLLIALPDPGVKSALLICMQRPHSIAQNGTLLQAFSLTLLLSHTSSHPMILKSPPGGSARNRHSYLQPNRNQESSAAKKRHEGAPLALPQHVAG
ncbi:hypothetical protein BU26DRAFT_203895 [Trematosphaeria pertusa]|uniref:Uncharacterized protein n=1 Tax=Trematosphaeria pertusa TaxID=390896 RepID=A0A6A6HR51_9PLEO|nr:uncharacterized protein BU26DRAFT_203895 [Trematosphaeria pertusa]KAF2240634.1 hypothetical protein BU26DRAFT_203895 [Trematosphaeria pertusa]